ncbi:hypothetical protein I2W78_27450 [Streptomyces spinoverrucosus]|uniref:hypothetical protein n=1 Tax=Streptomyces spinoverrucosus TaxID=284043 RepID=UPI0018C38AE1|nr:hypothetical protein [Streptomyces spinoverrucosus]MBG0855476.1 hypothetical protein [Streptomyces spinoverrucosus]
MRDRHDLTSARTRICVRFEFVGVGRDMHNRLRAELASPDANALVAVAPEPHEALTGPTRVFLRPDRAKPTYCSSWAAASTAAATPPTTCCRTPSSCCAPGHRTAS